MNWHQRPELRDGLAAEYVLGTMSGGARRRFANVMLAHADVARAVARWEARLEPLCARLPELPAGDELWSRIAQRSFGTATTAMPAVPGPVRAAAVRASAGWGRWLAPIPAAALSFGVMLGLGMPVVWQLTQVEHHDTQLPESYVGVLATAAGKPGLIVSSLRRGRTVDVKLLQPVALPAGSTLFLWTLDDAGVPQAVGALPPLPAKPGGVVSLSLPQPSEDLFFRAVELAVSVEASGALPSAPAGDFVYRGLCGKLWRVGAP